MVLYNVIILKKPIIYDKRHIYLMLQLRISLEITLHYIIGDFDCTIACQPCAKEASLDTMAPNRVYTRRGSFGGPTR